MDVVPTGSPIRKSFFACFESFSFTFSLFFFRSAVPLLGLYDVSSVSRFGDA